MKTIYCPECGNKMVNVWAGDNPLMFCESCKKHWDTEVLPDGSITYLVQS